MKMVLNYVGDDSWSRPVYESKGTLYVDVDPRSGRPPHICTKTNNDFDGEPDSPLPDDATFEFVPFRVTW